jgi:hypothetical protein
MDWSKKMDEIIYVEDETLATKARRNISDAIALKDEKIRRKLAKKNREDAMRINRAAYMKSIATKLNAALELFLDNAYIKTSAGWMNIDPDTNMVKIPVPWSAKNYKLYGLTRGQADILKLYIQDLSVDPENILGYDMESCRWFINRKQYRSHREAMRWLSENLMTVEIVQVISKQIKDRKS